jgi:hypothetical protein
MATRTPPQAGTREHEWWCAGAAYEAHIRDESLSAEARGVRDTLEALAALSHNHGQSAEQLVGHLAAIYCPAATAEEVPLAAEPAEEPQADAEELIPVALQHSEWVCLDCPEGGVHQVADPWPAHKHFGKTGHRVNITGSQSLVMLPESRLRA